MLFPMSSCSSELKCDVLIYEKQLSIFYHSSVDIYFSKKKRTDEITYLIILIWISMAFLAIGFVQISAIINSYNWHYFGIIRIILNINCIIFIPISIKW